MPGACPLAAHIVLEWIGAPYETVRMSIDALGSPAYLALNPGGTVPLLEHGGFLLTENVAILGYLADLHPAMRLAGDGSARGRAEVMRWVAFINSDVHGAYLPIFAPQRFLADTAHATELGRMARQRVRVLLERLNVQLRGRDWLTGERSIADPYLFVVLRWAAHQDISMHDLGHLAAFARRMEEDAAVRSAIATEEGVPATSSFA